MFYVYLSALVFGGILVGAGLVSGDDDAHDGHGHHHGHDHGSGLTGWTLLGSLRFWMFLTFFFGLTGTLLTWLENGPLLTLLVSGAMGLGLGSGLSVALHKLSKRHVSSNVTNEDYIGARASALLPIAPERTGKIRVYLKGQAHDLQAVVVGDEEIGTRDEVVIVELQEHVAVVTSAKNESTSIR
jgi:hypothetical protein